MWAVLVHTCGFMGVLSGFPKSAENPRDGFQPDLLEPEAGVGSGAQQLRKLLLSGPPKDLISMGILLYGSWVQ